MRFKISYKLFEQERERQRDLGYTEEHDEHHTVGEFLIMLEKQLNDAKSEWYRSGDSAALKPLVQLGAMVAACIETHYEDDVSNPPAKKVDMYGKQCTRCSRGFYTEKSINDDWDGVLHCNACSHETPRHIKE